MEERVSARKLAKQGAGFAERLDSGPRHLDDSPARAALLLLSRNGQVTGMVAEFRDGESGTRGRSHPRDLARSIRPGPLIGVDRRSATTSAEVDHEEQVAGGVSPASNIPFTLTLTGFWKNQKPTAAFPLLGVAVEAGVQDLSPVDQAGEAVGVGGGEGVGDIVLILQLPIRPLPLADAVDVLAGTAGKDVVADVVLTES